MVSNIFILDKNLKTKLILSVNGHNTFFKDLYDLDLSTGTESYEFSTTAEDINESDYVMFLYHGDYKLFQIIDIEQEHREGKIITSVYGESACLELLNGVTKPIKNEDKAVPMTARAFIERVLEENESNWQLKKYSSSLDNKVVDVKIDKSKQIWTVIQDYMKEFGYEITTRVKYENGYVKKKYIDVYAEGELGNKTCKRFEYSRNVKGITKKKNLYDFCTALILETKHDTNGIGYGNVSGDVLKPKNGIIKDPKSNAVYAVDNNKIYNANKNWIYGVYEDNDSNSGSETVTKAAEELRRRSVPKFDYECDTALTYEDYENINIGDTVYVIDHTFNPIITLEARVGKLEISFTDRDSCKCTLTNYKEIKTRITADDSHIKELLDRTTIQYGDTNTGQNEITLKNDYMDTKAKLEQHLLDCENCGCDGGGGDSGALEEHIRNSDKAFADLGSRLEQHILECNGTPSGGTLTNPIEFYTNGELTGKIGSSSNGAVSGVNRRHEIYIDSEVGCNISMGTGSLGRGIMICDEELGLGGYHYYEGVNIIQPTVIDTMKFAGWITLDKEGDTYVGVGQFDVDPTYKRFYISGRRELHLGLIHNGARRNLLSFETVNHSGDNGVYYEYTGSINADINFCNKKITNAQIGDCKFYSDLKLNSNKITYAKLDNCSLYSDFNADDNKITKAQLNNCSLCSNLDAGYKDITNVRDLKYGYLGSQSEYTELLVECGTNENETYSNKSYDSGEIRWCHKENVFTYAESEIDPETDEWVYTGRYICYVELPIFMAENIQNDYHINVSKMSWGDYRIIEKTPYYFILESQEDNFAFTFEVVAKLNDNAIIANDGLAEPEDIDNTNED